MRLFLRALSGTGSGLSAHTNFLKRPSQPSTLPNFWSLVADLPKYGLQTKVYRKSWADKGYDPEGHHYLITRVAVKKQEAWGIRCWKGKVDDAPKVITKTEKREWVTLS